MTRRGWQPTDDHDFSPEQLKRLQRAGSELSFLLDHDYPRDSAVEFVGNRYQFTARQRLFLTRGVSGEMRRIARSRKLAHPHDLAGAHLLIDGFNTIVVAECALSGSPVIRAQDGAVRDLAGVSGNYRLVDQTMRAFDLIMAALRRWEVATATFYFDERVSNSGRLATTLTDYVAALRSLSDEPCEISFVCVPDADKELAGHELVASNDSAVIDRCESWVSLDEEALRDLPHVWWLEALG